MAKEENEKEKNKPKPCPKWLNNTAKKEWRRVAKILAEEGKDFTDKDLKALEAYCINYAKWQRCEQIIDEKGYSNQDDYPFLFQAYLELCQTEDPLRPPGCHQRTGYYTLGASPESNFSFLQLLVLVCKLLFFCLP